MYEVVGQRHEVRDNISPAGAAATAGTPGTARNHVTFINNPMCCNAAALSPWGLAWWLMESVCETRLDLMPMCHEEWYTDGRGDLEPLRSNNAKMFLP